MSALQAYYVDEAAFALPAGGLVDRTLHRLEAPLAGEQDPLVVEIRRLPLEHGATLRQRALAEIAEEQERAGGLFVDASSEVDLDGAAALLVRARLRARDTVYLRLSAHVALEQVWLSFVVTGPASARATCEETFERLVRGLRWRRL